MDDQEIVEDDNGKPTIFNNEQAGLHKESSLINQDLILKKNLWWIRIVMMAVVLIAVFSIIRALLN